MEIYGLCGPQAAMFRQPTAQSINFLIRNVQMRVNLPFTETFARNEKTVMSLIPRESSVSTCKSTAGVTF